MSFKIDPALHKVIAPGVIQRISDGATIHNPGKGLRPVKNEVGGFSTVLWLGDPLVSDVLEMVKSPTQTEAFEVVFDEVPSPIEAEDDSIVEDDEDEDEDNEEE